jgi:hypothetical protein
MGVPPVLPAAEHLPERPICFVHDDTRTATRARKDASPIVHTDELSAGDVDVALLSIAMALGLPNCVQGYATASRSPVVEPASQHTQHHLQRHEIDHEPELISRFT